MGIISFTCDNAVSKLSITFGDVYLDNGNSYAATLTGDYTADDSNMMEYTQDQACTSLNLAGVAGLPAELPWLDGKNRVVYVAEECTIATDNVVKGSVCQSLKLSDNGGIFRPATAFTANEALLTVDVAGARMLMLPFAANVPEGVKAYTVSDDFICQETTTIAAHQPVLVEATGFVTFKGSGEVAYATSPLDASLRGTYAGLPLFAGDYILGQKDGQWGWVRQTAVSTLAPFDAYAQISSQENFIPLNLTTAIEDIDVASPSLATEYYDLQGRRIANISNIPAGQIIIIRSADGVRKWIKK